MSDLVGTDISVYIGKNYKEAYSGRVYLSQLMPLMAKYKRLGEKTKKGFYIVSPINYLFNTKYLKLNSMMITNKQLKILALMPS